MLDDWSNIASMNRTRDTRDRLIRAGAEIIARQGFSSTGINQVLAEVGVPKGSFYHYFASKNDFGLAVIDSYARAYRELLDITLGNDSLPPLARLNAYFTEGVARMEQDACASGCLIGNLGQELAAQNELFRERLNAIFASWEQDFAQCLTQAKADGELREDADPRPLAAFILSGWQGALLRAKLVKSPEPLRHFKRLLGQLLAPAGKSVTA